MIAKMTFTKEYCNVRFLSDPDMADKVNAACRSQIRKRMQHNRNKHTNTHGAVKPMQRYC